MLGHKRENEILELSDSENVSKKSFVSEYLIKKDLKNSNHNRSIISSLLDNVASIYKSKSQIISYLDRRLLGFFRTKDSES